MKVLNLWPGLVLGLLLQISAHAQVPPMINYQGRVAIGSTNFDGTGQFKFALVNADSSATYWSNGTAAVSLTVTKGLYSVLLGDTGTSNMTDSIPPAVFTNPDVRLRVWFDDGVHGSQQLTPDQRIASVGYAMQANSVPAAGIIGTLVPTGAVMPFAGPSAPEGWLLCAGSAVSRTTYSNLFAVVGTTYGAGDGSATFNVPSLQGRVPVGYDSTQTEFNNLGMTGGEKIHTLTIDEMPAHGHSYQSAPWTGSRYDGHTAPVITQNQDATTGLTGGGQPHNNLQPYQVLNYIIKF